MKIHFDPLALIQTLRWRPETVSGIRIEHVAEKLRALRALEHPEAAHQLTEEPRLAELLLFVQWLSQQPGGLEKAVRDRLLAVFPENVGTCALHAIEPGRNGHFRSIEDLANVWDSIPERFRTWPAALSERHRDAINLWLIEDPKRLRAIEREGGDTFSDIVGAITPEYCWRLCARAMAETLPRYLDRLCNEPGHPFPDNTREDESYLLELADAALLANARSPETETASHAHPTARVRPRGVLWYGRNLKESLFAMMDRHAANVRASIAQTQVARQCFDELDFAISSGVPVFIAGDARFGKTVAHKTWCEAYPARARLVSTPPTCREWDFYAAHADALGISYSGDVSARKLAREVQFVIKHTGLFLCYDEAHHLLPTKVSRTSKPWRMDWVRCHVLDAGNPAAFIATRQTFGKSLAQFVKVTHHQMEQWFDRMNRPLMLPGEVSRADILAVAAHNFPTLPKRQLEFIAAEAMGADSAFHAVKLIAKRAVHFARIAGRTAPTDDDVTLAIADWKSRPSQKDFENPVASPEPPDRTRPPLSVSSLPPRAPSVTDAGPLHGRGSRAAKPAQAAPAREISPANTTVNRVALPDEADPILVG